MDTTGSGESSKRKRSRGGHQLSLDPYYISAQSNTTRRPQSNIHDANGPGMPGSSEDRPLSHTSSSSQRLSRIESSSTLRSQEEEHGRVRTLPSWIESFEVGDPNLPIARAGKSVIAAPTQAVTAKHHHGNTDTSRSPPPRRSLDGYESDEEPGRLAARQPARGIFGGEKAPVRGRKWDFARDEEPVIISRAQQSQTPWVVNLVKSSMYGPAPNEDRKLVDYDFLAAQTPGYLRPWRGDLPDSEKGEGLLHNKKRRRMWYQRAQHTLLMHPLVPLAFRVTVLTTSVIALGLSASIFALTHGTLFSQSPSTIMAIVVDTIAIPYIMYITWDEYTGKPLGLRSPKAKIRLVLLDLFFIIFESANLAIAFGSLSDDDGSCRLGTNGTNMILCRRVKGLASFLLIALIAWTLTFAVSIFRLVERVGGREEGD